MLTWIPAAMAAAVRLYYRLEISGASVPPTGAALLVANHPNSLLDAAMVTAAAHRPVRFLAKSTLVEGRAYPWPIRWLVRASGAIPVYRPSDGVAPSGGNDEAFRAVRAALASGSIVALFPEGISHARSALAPLKSGAARIALGVAQTTGRAMPIVPIGLLLDDRAIFRSTARIIVGTPIPWDDLVGCPDSDAAAVRDLTTRIQSGLRAVTVNYASWEDAHLVTLADAVHAAAGPPPSTAARPARHALGTATLARLRDSDDPAWRLLADDLRAHARLLRTLRLTPADLYVRSDLRVALGWGLRRIPLLALSGLATLGTLLAWPAYRLVGPIAARMPEATDVDVRATAKLLVGGVVFLIWTCILAALAGFALGPWAALATLILAPALALVALLTAEGWQASWRDARRFLTLRHRTERIAILRSRQTALAQRIDTLVSSVSDDAGVSTARAPETPA
jgi:1-acyl-sn-glycerol-3-phosphate acyltransferase